MEDRSTSSKFGSLTDMTLADDERAWWMMGVVSGDSILRTSNTS